MTLRARLSATTLVALAVVGALVARGITDHDGPVLPLVLCRAGQTITYLPPLSAHTAFTAWQGDVLFDIGIGLALLAYAVGAHRYRVATGRRWPWGRTLAFCFGLLLLTVTLNSAVAVYDMTLFSAHMLEHLLLLMVVPAFLVLGRPLTMLLESHPTGALRRLCDRPELSYVFAAPTAFGTYVVVIVGTHLTGFMGYVMAHAWAGQVEHLLYLVAGIHFFTAAVGNAPVRWRLSFPGRLLMVMLAMAVDAFVGIVLMQSVVPIATLAHPGWGPTMLSDTHLGGALMWVVGDGLMALVPVALYISWARHSEAKPETPGWYERARVGMFVSNGAPDEGAQTDLDVDSDEAQHVAYNRWLASLSDRR